MSDPRVITNLNWRDFVYRADVPEEVLNDQFDWTDDDDCDGFIHYRGTWYHLSQFMVGGIEGWQGSHGDSFFSGVVINLSDDGEQYQIGTYLS